MLNAPLDATLNESAKPSILFGDGPSSPIVSIVCAVLFGISDAATSITMLALVSDVFGHEHDETVGVSNSANLTRVIQLPVGNGVFENDTDDTAARKLNVMGTGHSPPHVVTFQANVPPVMKLQREQATATANAMLIGTQTVLGALMMVLSPYLWFYWYMIMLIPCAI